jgi:hypothetical protein
VLGVDEGADPAQLLGLADMMLPLPNCFSIVDTATSMAFSRAESRSRTGAGAKAGALTAASLLSVLLSLFSVVAMVCSPGQLEIAGPSSARDRKT